MKYLLLILAALSLFSSCSIAPGDIRIEDWNRMDVIGSTLTQSRVNVGVEMVNDSRVKVTLREANFRLYTASGSEILEISVEEPVTLPKRSTTDVTLPLIVRYKGELGALSSLSRLKGDLSAIEVTGTARLKGSGISKTYEWRGISLQEFLQLLGVDDMGDFKIGL